MKNQINDPFFAPPGLQKKKIKMVNSTYQLSQGKRQYHKNTKTQKISSSQFRL